MNNTAIKWHSDPTPEAPRWRATVNGRTVAWAVRTGRPGIDDYPWDWYIDERIADLYDWQSARTMGTSDTLRATKSNVLFAWDSRRVKS